MERRPITVGVREGAHSQGSGGRAEVKPQWAYRTIRRDRLPFLRLGRQIRIDEDSSEDKCSITRGMAEPRLVLYQVHTAGVRLSSAIPTAMFGLSYVRRLSARFHLEAPQQKRAQPRVVRLHFRCCPPLELKRGIVQQRHREYKNEKNVKRTRPERLRNAYGTPASYSGAHEGAHS